jgi:hypothetical protein
MPRRRVVIALLNFNETAVEKLGARDIAPEDIEQITANRYVALRNPRPRVDGSILLIGTTDGGRLLTVVLNPVAADSSEWDVATAWDASPAQAARYRKDA